MNNEAFDIAMRQVQAYANSISRPNNFSSDLRRRGCICSACGTPLPRPYPLVERLCDNCKTAPMHSLSMHVKHCGDGWICRFTDYNDTASNPKQLFFHDKDKIYELARRANAADTDLRRLNMIFRRGRGAIWLMLTHKQFQALCGNNTVRTPQPVSE